MGCCIQANAKNSKQKGNIMIQKKPVNLNRNTMP